MQVRIKKEIEIVVDVPEEEVADYFGENCTENDFVIWADRNMNVKTWEEDVEENPKSFVNYETLKEIEIQDKSPKFQAIKSKYSEKWINYITEEIDRVDRCYECTGYGDDYDQDMNCNCDSCPFNEPSEPPSEDE